MSRCALTGLSVGGVFPGRDTGAQVDQKVGAGWLYHCMFVSLLQSCSGSRRLNSSHPACTALREDIRGTVQWSVVPQSRNTCHCLALCPQKKANRKDPLFATCTQISRNFAGCMLVAEDRKPQPVLNEVRHEMPFAAMAVCDLSTIEGEV